MSAGGFLVVMGIEEGGEVGGEREVSWVARLWAGALVWRTMREREGATYGAVGLRRARRASRVDSAESGAESLGMVEVQRAVWEEDKERGASVVAYF